MKFLVTLVICAFLATPALAAFEGPGAGASQGGFNGPVGGAQAETAAKALTLDDDAPVVLTGNLVEKMAGSKDKYLFKDATGTITVDIDHKYFQGREVTPQDTIRISGKIDKDYGKPAKVDVKFLEILKK